MHPVKYLSVYTKGIINKVEGPTDWVNSLIIVEKKDGSLRLSLDPSKLNKSIKGELFYIPTLEDVTSRLGNKKLFTVLNQKDLLASPFIIGMFQALCLQFTFWEVQA